MAQNEPDKHTQYAIHASLLDNAKTTIRQNRKYFFPATELPPEGEDGDWGKWLVHVTVESSLRNASIQQREANPATANTPETVKMRQARDSEVEHYNQAVDAYPIHLQAIQKLESTNDRFLAPVSKINEYQHILDEETCRYLCAASPVTPIQQQSPSTPCSCQFFGEKTIELTGNQTDAVRVWNSNSHLKNLTVMDNRTYTEAHRDAFQLIPPKITDKTRKIRMIKDGEEQEQDWILCDQMSAAILENVTVEACTVKAPGGPLQGIFSSDGLFSNLKILNNTIQTAGEHAITINGFLSGKISGNTLQAVAGKTPAIRLYPTRIGGNQAEEGVAWILSFANEGGSNPVLQYSKPVLGNNPLVGVAGKTQAELIDARSDMPENYRWNSFGLESFRYYAFRDEFSNLTFGQYRTLDGGKYYTQLKAWLEDRIAEYTTGVRKIPDSLPNINNVQTTEQYIQVRPTLLKALANALNSSTYDHVSISNFPETPVKVFVAKQIALRHGTLKKLVALNGIITKDGTKIPASQMEKRRQATLKYLLSTAQLADTVANPLPDPALQQGTTTAAQGATGTTGAVGATGTTGGTNSALTTTALPKNYGILKILAQPLTVQQGDTITFSADASLHSASGDKLAWYWSANGKTTSTATFTLDTTGLAVGEYSVKATLYVTPAGTTQRTNIAGSAMFNVTEKAAAPTPPTAQEPPPTPVLPKPLTASGALGMYLRVSETSVPQGKTVTFSIDPAYLAQQQQGAKLTYYWTAPLNSGNPAGQAATYTIKTDTLVPGNNHVVKVTLYRQADGTTTKTSQGGVATFGVTAAAPATGTINVVVMDVDTQQPIVGEKYTLTLDSDLAKSYPGTTGANGSILVKDIPLGRYTLSFENPAFLSAEIIL